MKWGDDQPWKPWPKAVVERVVVVSFWVFGGRARGDGVAAAGFSKSKCGRLEHGTDWVTREAREIGRAQGGRRVRWARQVLGGSGYEGSWRGCDVVCCIVCMVYVGLWWCWGRRVVVKRRRNERTWSVRSLCSHSQRRAWLGMQANQTKACGGANFVLPVPVAPPIPPPKQICQCLTGRTIVGR